jgi:predicted O-methyltransferase YrrM
MARVSWRDDARLDVDGVPFLVSAIPLTTEAHLIIKSPHLVRRYLDLLEVERPRRIVELGVRDGGSTALMALAAAPDLLVAVDLDPDPPSRLADLVRSRDLGDRVAFGFGIDQGDREALTALVERHAPDGPLDLVVDDASHLLGPTTTSFEVLFPRLGPGGLYVIEDWSWECLVAAHLAQVRPDINDERLSSVTRVVEILNAPGGTLPPELVREMSEANARRGATDGNLFGAIVEAAADVDPKTLATVEAVDRRPMADLAVAMMMTAATRPGLICELTVDSEWLTVRRGDDEVSADEFRLGEPWYDAFGYLTADRQETATQATERIQPRWPSSGA